MRYVRQNTATTVVVGPFVSPTDGSTPVTTLPDQAAAGNARVIKSGGGSALTGLASWAHDGQGHYAVGLAAGHVDTVGRLRLQFASPGSYLPVWEHFAVLAPAVYDWLFGDAAPSTYAGADTPGTAALLARLTAGRATNLDNLDAAVSTRSTYAGADTPGTAALLVRIPGIVAPQTGDAFARLGVPAGTSISHDVSAVRSGIASQGGTLDEIRAATHVTGVVVAEAAKAGYKLAADGLDAIPITPPVGPATTFRGMVVQSWRRWFKKAVYDLTAGELRTFADDGATVVTTQALAEDASRQTVGDAR